MQTIYQLKHQWTTNGEWMSENEVAFYATEELAVLAMNKMVESWLAHYNEATRGAYGRTTKYAAFIIMPDGEKNGFTINPCNMVTDESELNQI